MKRRRFLSLLGGAATAWPILSHAQPSGRRPLIALLSVANPPTFQRYRASLLAGLHQSGLFEGRNIEFVERYADGYLDRLPALAEELVRSKPDVLVAHVTSTALALKQFTTTVPIVVAAMADPLRVGLIKSEARPGGNVTGILINLDGLPGKQLQVAAELVPGATKVGFLFNSSNPGIAFMRAEAEAAASAMGVKLVVAEAGSPRDIDAAFGLLARENVGSVLISQDSTFNSERNRIAALASAARLPLVAGQREYVEAGAVISYGINAAENFRRLGAYIEKILKGTPASELPVELPSSVEMVINLKSAKALGLTVSPAMLGHADEVIE
jgi:putative ABC transport system substrate-binding protein